MRKGITLTAGAMVALVACTSAVRVDPEVELALRDAANAYHRTAAKGAETVVSLYATDTMVIPPNADRVEDIDNIRNYRFGFIVTPGVDLRFETIRTTVSASGEMGWTLTPSSTSLSSGQMGRPGTTAFATSTPGRGRKMDLGRSSWTCETPNPSTPDPRIELQNLAERFGERAHGPIDVA